MPACEAEQLGRTTAVVAPCQAARDLCANTADPDDLMYWVMVDSAAVASPTAADWLWTGQQCRNPAAIQGAVVVPALSLQEFRRLPLPPGRVNVQPPTLRTLVNVPTNVYVDARPLVVPTTLLGFPVQVRATPVAYRWRFGDGGVLETTDPGAAYPALRTSHVYRRPGVVSLVLTTSYTGAYSVAGGPWLPVEGEADVTTDAVDLHVVAARAELVGPVRP